MFRISDFSLKVDQNLTLFHVNCTEVSYNVTKCVLKMASLGFWKTILAGLNHSVEQNITHRHYDVDNEDEFLRQNKKISDIPWFSLSLTYVR